MIRKRKLVHITALTAVLITMASTESFATDQEGQITQFNNIAVQHITTAGQIKDFQNYFDKIIRYNVEPNTWWDAYTDQQRFHKINITEKEISQKLIKLAPSLSFFDDKMEGSEHTYLELLFRNNLNFVAEEVCTTINESNEKIPGKYEILLKISQGESPEINLKTVSIDFISLAYIVANNSKNISMVKRLYPLTDIEKKAESIKQSCPGIYDNVNSVHEPYWSYNMEQLQAYGDRISKRLSPYFVTAKSVLKNKNGTFIYFGNEEIKVRTIEEFGYVLPNLYLKERLANEKDNDRAVAKLFLLPKGKKVNFKFKMPYAPTSSGMAKKVLQHGSGSNNPLEIMSKDFIVYQEWIDGKGQTGNTTFEDLGHRDSGPIQIIKSNKDYRDYLIDTKERKNFFAPYFSPYNEDYTLYKNFHDQFSITSQEDYKLWKQNSQAVIYDAKKLHFDPRIIYVEVEVDL